MEPNGYGNEYLYKENVYASHSNRKTKSKHARTGETVKHTNGTSSFAGKLKFFLCFRETLGGMTS